MQSPAVSPQPPSTFSEYLRSLGPGIVAMLTWLGAGDVVTAGVSGGNYGYALMWVLALAVLMRCVFVMLIAKYQLCNPRGESVVEGLIRLHPAYAPFLAIAAVILGHVYGSYMVVGCGETWVKLTGAAATWQWSILWSLLALGLVFRHVYRNVELVFKLMLGVLSVSLLGTAIWAGPNAMGIARGLFAFELPATVGPFDSVLVAIGMVGAVGGSMMNLAYPYFMEQKGWRGPAYRRVQFYDLLLAVVVMIMLNLAVWTLGAEVIHGRGQSVDDLDGLAKLLGIALGANGQRLFYLGVFAAVFTSLIGIALVVAYLANQGFSHWLHGQPAVSNGRVHHVVTVWVLVSPLVWTLPGMPSFVTLTLLGNAIQVVVVPLLAGGVWWITASSRFIGVEYRNRWWENLFMAVMFSIAVWATIGIFRSVAAQLWTILAGTAS
ncbi:MAG: Nramp family divalent metal transporter [Planctomycetota bacterium]